MAKIQKLIWTTVQKRINDLIPQDANPRIITDKQMEDLKKSLTKYNLVEIPAIDLNGRILAGHQRIKALQLLGRGDEIIDVRLPNRKLTDDEAKYYLIASNALGGDWDFDALRSFDLDLLTDIGFDQIGLAKFWDTDKEVLDDDFDVEKELKAITKPKTKLGDVIILGKHKIICGDSTKPETLEKLFVHNLTYILHSLGNQRNEDIQPKQGS